MNNLVTNNFKLNSLIQDGLLNVTEIALLFVIINLQNKLQIESFGLPTKATAGKLNLSLPTYYRTLQSLQEKQLITILESGVKSKAPTIQIIFDKENESYSIKDLNHIRTKIFSESVNINNKEERIKNKDLNDNNKSKMEKYEQLKPSDCKEYIQERIEQHKEQLQMSLSISEEKIQRSLDYFIEHNELQNQIYNFKSESWKHFLNWLKSYDIDKVKKQPTKRTIFEKKSQRFETFEELKRKVNGNN